MTISLHNLHPNPGATKNRKRLGRGRGSGTGKTSGKGVKGQTARPGHHGARVGFEGGQMPMQRRLPKRGSKNPFRVEAFPVNLAQLGRRFEAGAPGTVVDVEAMREVGLVPKNAALVKVLSEGELGRAFVIKAHRFSAKAKQKIEAAGGRAEALETPVAPGGNQQ